MRPLPDNLKDLSKPGNGKKQIVINGNGWADKLPYFLTAICQAIEYNHSKTLRHLKFSETELTDNMAAYIIERIGLDPSFKSLMHIDLSKNMMTDKFLEKFKNLLPNRRDKNPLFILQLADNNLTA